MPKMIKILLPIYLLIELTLYVLIFLTEGSANIAISFSVIAINFLFSLLLFSKSSTIVLTQIGLLTTMCADFFLIILNPRIQLVAMLFFCVTQICYFVRLYLTTKSHKVKMVHLISRIVVSVLAIVATFIVVKDKVDALSLISVFYFVNLFLNLIFAFLQTKKSCMFAVGLLLFLMCDVLIGLQVAIGTYIDIPSTSLLYKIAYSNFNYAWLFYVPAQIFIVLSLIFNNYKRTLSSKQKKQT